jgi:hypothetical protein
MLSLLPTPFEVSKVDLLRVPVIYRLPCGFKLVTPPQTKCSKIGQPFKLVRPNQKKNKKGLCPISVLQI